MTDSRTEVPTAGEPPVRIPIRIVIVAAIVAAAGLMVALYGTSPTDAGSAGALPSGTPLGVQTCSQLESANGLNTSLADLYNGFSLQGYGAGPNSTPALGIASYPNLPAGQAALNAAWASICESGQFGYAYVQANGSSGFFFGGELAQDGHYDFFYGFNWHDECSAADSNVTSPCQATATWTVDLVTDAVSGPSWSNVSQTPLGAP